MLTIHREILNNEVILPYEDFEKVVSLLRKSEEVELVDIKRKKKESVEALIGMGQDIWKNIDAVEYQRNERNGW